MQDKKRTADEFYRESKHLRKEVLEMADGGMYKPYVIISQAMFDAEVKNLKKGTPF